MEKLDVFDCSNVMIASYFTDDRGCAHENREHTLIYLCSGELEIDDHGQKTILRPGECAFLREFYQTLNRNAFGYLAWPYSGECMPIGQSDNYISAELRSATEQALQRYETSMKSDG